MTAGHAMSETRCGGCQHDLSRHVGIVSTQPGKVYCLDCVGVPDICWMLACPDCGAPCAPGGLHICPMRGAVRVPDFHPASPAPLDETNPLVRLMVAEADEPAPPFAAPRDETPTPKPDCIDCDHGLSDHVVYEGVTICYGPDEEGDTTKCDCHGFAAAPLAPEAGTPTPPATLEEAIARAKQERDDARLGAALREALATVPEYGELRIRNGKVSIFVGSAPLPRLNDATRALAALLHSSAPQTRETT